MNLKQLKGSEVSTVREEILNEQNGLCAICKEVITEDSGVSLDHQHKFQYETNGEDGAGLIRGVLCRACNVEEGKAWNSMCRYIQPKNVQERIDWLESLVEYYKKAPYPMIHPSEKTKEQKVSKRNYNKLKKEYSLSSKKAKFPDYPKSGKLTKKLSELFNEFEIAPFN